MGDYQAYVVAGCPDNDGDGVDELLVGSAGNSEVELAAGAAYLVYGGDD